MEKLLLDLLCRLEAIGDRDESLFDTVVRENMSEAVFLAFIRPTPGYQLPDDYEMPDEENRQIKEALQSYIDGAIALAAKLGLDTFHERLAAFQNEDVHTRQKNYFDDFFGWWDPKLYDEAGNFIRRG